MQRELGKVTLGVDSSGEAIEAGSFAAEQAALANAGAPPLIAQPAVVTTEKYLEIATASAAWLAIPLTLGASAAGMAGAAKQVAQTAIKGTASAPPVPGGIEVPSTSFPGLHDDAPKKDIVAPSFLDRLLAFAFPRA